MQNCTKNYLQAEKYYNANMARVNIRKRWVSQWDSLEKWVSSFYKNLPEDAYISTNKFMIWYIFETKWNSKTLTHLLNKKLSSQFMC